MSAVLTYVDGSKKYSYQHLHGVMLVNLNKIASKDRLSHTEYRIMGVLIGLWNKNTNKSFPSINYLSELCRMSKATILKTLKLLEQKELIIIHKEQGKRNNYYFSNQIICLKPYAHVKPVTIPSCKTTHNHEQIKNITDKKISSSKLILKNDDDLAFINQKLLSWGVCSTKQFIMKYGKEKMKLAIQIVQENKPKNYGAYLRTILKGNLQSRQNSNDIEKIDLINQMLKKNFWKHIPSNKIYRVKPDIGQHLFIKYNKELQEITFVETNFTDKLSNFEPCEYIEISQNDKIKPSKKKVLNDLIQSGNDKEAMILKKVWKISDDVNV